MMGNDINEKADAIVNEPGSLSNFGALQERVRGIDLRLGDLAVSLKETNVALRSAIEAMSLLGKPKWQLWSGFATVIVAATVGMWNLAIAPIGARVTSLEQSASTFVPREVHIEHWEQQKVELNRIENEISARATKDDLNRLIIELDRRLPKTRNKE